MTQTTSQHKQPKTTIQPADVARIQGIVAKPLGGQIPKGSYVGRMQRTTATSVASKKSK